MDGDRKAVLLEILGQTTLQSYETMLLETEGQNIYTRAATDIVQDLVVGYPREWGEDPSGNIILPTILPKDGMRHVRDAVAVLPSGIVIGAIQRLRRRQDPALMRAIFLHHPRFAANISLDFDQKLQRAASEGIFATPSLCSLEGGNIQVLSEDSIALGVSSIWSHASYDAERYCFQTIIEELFRRDPTKHLQRVYVVNLPAFQHFWHLDSIFNMLGPKSAIVMPYIFDYPMALAQSVLPFVRRIASDLVLSPNYPLSEYGLPSESDLSLSGLTEVYLRRDFERAGRPIPSGDKAMKFLDRLHVDGLLDLDEIVWVGGNSFDFSSLFEHIRVAFREQASQACNIFTVRPYCVLAFDHVPFTLAALACYLTNHNGYVKVVPGLEEARSGGGPHCLTVDLERDS